MNHPECTSCDLCHEARSVGIMGEGKPNGILFIGIGPGSEEDYHGRPFVGRSGVRLRTLVSTYIKSPAAYYNVVGCRPVGDKPTLSQASTCWGLYSHENLTRFNPRVIVALGQIASEFLVSRKLPGTKSLSVSNFRKRVDDLNGVPIIHTYHPAATLRTSGRRSEMFFEALRDDIQKADRYARGLIEIHPEFIVLDECPTGDIIIDLETETHTGGALCLRPWEGKIVKVGMSPFSSPKSSWICSKPFSLKFSETWIYPSNARKSSTNGLVVGWNLAFDSQWMRKESLMWSRPWMDGLVLHGLLYPEATLRGLKTVGPPISGISYEKTLEDELTPDELDDYLRRDLANTGIAVKHLLEKAEKSPVKKAIPFVMELTRRLARLSLLGCKIDRREVERVSDDLFTAQGVEIGILQTAASLAGCPLRSKPKPEKKTYYLSKSDLLRLFYTYLGFPEQYTEKGKLSLSKPARLELAKYDKEGYLEAYGRYLNAQKTVRTFILPLVENNWLDGDDMAHPIPHVIRAEREDEGLLGGGGAITGRVIWKDPSLQVFPESTKSVLVSRYTNGRIGTRDLSQIEPRVMAHLSQDDLLISAFIEGRDVYRTIMAEFLNIPYDEVTPGIRRVGKTVWLAISYGAQAEKIKLVLEVEGDVRMTLHNVQLAIDRFWKLLPGYMSYVSGIREDLAAGYPIVSPTGRIRRFPVTEEPDVQRQAINFPTQEFASAINHAFLLEMPEKFNGIMPIAPTIYDSLTFDVQSQVTDAAFNSSLDEIYNEYHSIIKSRFGVDFTVPIKWSTKLEDRWS